MNDVLGTFTIDLGYDENVRLISVILLRVRGLQTELYRNTIAQIIWNTICARRDRGIVERTVYRQDVEDALEVARAAFNNVTV